jgi:Bacterial Ig domain
VGRPSMTHRPLWRHFAACALASLVVLCGAMAPLASAAPGSTLTVLAPGTGSGVITSSPAGIDCGSGPNAATHSVCSFQFDTTVTSVALTATPDTGMGFGGFGGACTGTVCSVSLSADASATATFDKPPTVTVSAPVGGQAYSAGVVPAADFTCSPDTGSIIHSCAATVDGSGVTQGATLPNGTGPHTLIVTATDADGAAPTTANATYTVNAPPACPDASATTNESRRVGITLRCNDPHATAITDQIDSGPRHGTLMPTSTGEGYTPAAGFAGTDTFTYHGVSVNGPSAMQTVTIVVLAPPTADVSDPPAGQVYSVGQSVRSRFACADDPAGPGIRSCVDSAGAGGGTGTLNTATEGNHSYTVTATSRDGQTGTATLTYTVVGKAPQVVLIAPVDNAAYPWTAVPGADFACVAGLGSAVQSCQATVDRNAISDGQALPNSFGIHKLTVTATDADGLNATASATYTISSSVALPPVSIMAPAQSGRYRLRQVVVARYSCLAPTSGPALRSCVGTVRAGRAVNTRTPGTHTFSVSATDAEGSSTTETVTYGVTPTSTRFGASAVRAGRSGATRLRVTLPGPGSVKVTATAWNAAPRASHKRIVYGSAHVAARRAGRVLITLAPTAVGRALLRMRAARPVLSVVVDYTPAGGRSRVLRLKPFRVG